MALLYLLKVSVCLILFFGVYHFFFSGLTFFKLNRYYLLLIPVFSFAIPMLTIQRVTTVEVVANVNKVGIKYDENTSAEKDIEAIGERTAGYQWSTLFQYAYLSVAAFFLLRLCFIAARIKLQLRRYGISKHNGIVEVIPGSPVKNCSFFNLIILDAAMTAQDRELVIQHEMVHVNQRHALDKIFANVVAAILWFNPIIYFWRNAIDHNHEFLADEATIQVTDKRTYATLLLQLAMPATNLLANSFSKLPLKNRMMMLYKKPHARLHKLAYLSIVPVLLICSMAFINRKEIVVEKSIEKYSDAPQKPNVYAQNYLNNKIKVNPNALAALNQVEEMLLVLDAGHGGKDGASTAVNGLKEKDLNLRVVKILEEEALKRGIKVRLTRNSDEYVSLRDRLPLQAATAFISIHHNAGNQLNDTTFKGIEVIVSKENQNIRLIEELAGGILNSIKKGNGILINGSLKDANLLLLRESKVPAVLIEMGNISDEKSFEFINNEQNIRKISNLILDGFVQYAKRGC